MCGTGRVRMLSVRTFRPLGERPKAPGSYPSGHAHLRLSERDHPRQHGSGESSLYLFERGYEYGTNRVITGVHFPSDLGGRRASPPRLSPPLL